jgi:hypothetical protein
MTTAYFRLDHTVNKIKIKGQVVRTSAEARIGMIPPTASITANHLRVLGPLHQRKPAGQRSTKG